MKEINKTLILPDFLRKELAKPKGKLYNEQNPEKTVIANIKKLKPVITIAVGDVCTASIISQNFYPDIIIIDYKTKRKQITEFYENESTFNEKINKNYREKISIKNPQATIQANSWISIKNIIKESISSKKRFQIIVEGEEDLLVLPCVLESPNNSIVLYGQPDEGIVEIFVNHNIKKEFQALVSKFQELNQR